MLLKKYNFSLKFSAIFNNFQIFVYFSEILQFNLQRQIFISPKNEGLFNRKILRLLIWYHFILWL